MDYFFNNWLYVCVVFQRLLKFILLYFYPLNLILIIKPHNLPGLFDSFQQLHGFNIIPLGIFQLQMISRFLQNLFLKLHSSQYPPINNLWVSQNTVKRCHLFMTIITLDGIQIHLVNNFLLVLHNSGNLIYYKKQGSNILCLHFFSWITDVS